MFRPFLAVVFIRPLAGPEAQWRERLVRRAFTSDPAPDPRPAPTLATLATADGDRMVHGALATGPGLHRLRWDLLHPGGWDARASRSGSGGPLVVPGSYQVRLTVAGWTITQPLEVRLDPRVEAEGNASIADLQRQRDLALAVVETLSRARRAAAAIEAARDTASATRAATLNVIRAKHVNAPGPYPQEMLISQLEYLYGIVTSADFFPNPDAFDRLDELRAALDGHLARLEGRSGH